MKEILVQKLTSRKLWISIVGIIVGLAAAFGIQENDYAQTAGAVGSICSALVYILGESIVDKAAVSAPTEPDEDDEGDDFDV